MDKIFVGNALVDLGSVDEPIKEMIVTIREMDKELAREFDRITLLRKSRNLLFNQLEQQIPKRRGRPPRVDAKFPRLGKTLSI